MQKVRGGVVALGRVARAPVDVREHALAGLERAALGRDRDNLIVSEPQHVLHDRAAIAVGALDVAGIGHLSAAGGVERRLDQLDEHASVVGLDGADRRLPIGRLVADEVGREPGRAGERHRTLTKSRRPRHRRSALARDRVRCSPISASNPSSSTPELVLGDDLERQVDREPVRVVQQERVLRRDPLLPRVTGARDQLVEQLRALLERTAEALLLGLQPLENDLALLVQLRVLGPHQLGHALGVAAQEPGIEPERMAPLQDRAAHDPPQHVARGPRWRGRRRRRSGT